jgi:hypothetical protein
MLYFQPAVKLLDFFQGIASSNESFVDANKDKFESGGLANFDTTKAREFSGTMRNLSPITAEAGHRWVAYWNKVGLFK